MYCVPVTTNYVSLPVSYVPAYSTALDRALLEESNSRLSDDLSRTRRELVDLREEVSDLRLEKDLCPLCSRRVIIPSSYVCDVTCLICYPRPYSRLADNLRYRTASSVHYCSLCHDYVMDLTYPISSSLALTIVEEEDKLSDYLSRQLELYRLRNPRIPEYRPIWVPTAYKSDYPYRRWVTRRLY